MRLARELKFALGFAVVAAFAMSGDRSYAQGAPDPNAGPNDMRTLLLVKQGGAYSNADLLGSYLMAGSGIRATLVMDGLGHFHSTDATDASCDTADAAINCSHVIPAILRCTVVYGAKITSS